MSDVTEKNFQAIQAVLNEQAATIRAMQTRVTQLEGNVARLQAEVINSKQMMGHMSGRGMGSTVHN